MSLNDLAPGVGEDDPFEIDTSVAHPARHYNYWLGGTDNFEADRASGDAIAAVFPTTRGSASSSIFGGMELVAPGIQALPDWRNDVSPAERSSVADVSPTVPSPASRDLVPRNRNA